ncbi:MAG TPA: ornithine carbamoyltransferase, partial [Planctomycetes bacterium]|nr:ornithine carbamoyltransferase [Planctomycetota bacterium]
MKHFLTLDGLTSADFHGLLALANYLKDRRRKGIPDQCLAGKTLAMIFEKPSLRTRLSFEVAMVDFGGRGIYIRGEEIGL